MAFSLKVPALSDNPLLAAETRPQKISEYLATLPSDDVMAFGSGLFEEMENLNRQKVNADDRLRALEVYRDWLIKLNPALVDRYATDHLPLDETAASHAAMAEALWLELGYGYKLVLIEHEKKLFSLYGDKQNALLVQRALEALGQQAMVYHLTYIALPESIWSEANQLYLFAAQSSINNIAVEGATVGGVSPDLSYIQLAMMALAGSQRLTVQAIKTTAQYLVHYANLVSLSGIGMVDNPIGIYTADLRSSRGPVAYQRDAEDADPGSTLLLITINLARKLHLQVQQYKDHALVIPDILQEAAQKPEFLDLLLYLIRQWSEPPKRHFDRMRQNSGVEIALGLEMAHAAILEEQRVQHMNSPSLGAKSIHRWLLLNVSAGGVALRKPALGSQTISIGQVVALRENRRHWQLGVVRWASNSKDQQVDIGTQLIAPTAKAVTVHFENDSCKALLLPAIQMLKQPATIILPANFAGTGATCTVLEGECETPMTLDKRIGHSASYERYIINNI